MRSVTAEPDSVFCALEQLGNLEWGTVKCLGITEAATMRTKVFAWR